MNTMRKLAKLPMLLAATLVLTGCKFIDNLINTTLVNVAMQLPYIMNHLAINMTEDMGIEFTQFEEQPTSESKKASLNYFLDALVVPKKLELESFPYPVSFEWELVGDGLTESSFFVLEIAKEDLPPEMTESLPLDLEAYIFLPVGTFDGLDGVTTIDELTTRFESFDQSQLAEFADQEPGNATFKITATAGTKTKSKTFYFDFTAPDFGEQIVEAVFDSGVIVNIFDALEGTIESINNPPTNVNDALPIDYFKQTIAIPKQVTIDSVGQTITFDLNINYPQYFFQNTITKSMAEIDPGNTEISGDIEIYTLTPIGDYALPPSVTNIDTLKTHLEGLSAKQLYDAAVQEDRAISITVTAHSGAHEKSETYFFNLVEPPLDQEITDYAMDSNYIINTVFYKDVETITNVTPAPDEESKRLDVEYLTQTIVIPESVVLGDFDNRTIEFDITVSNESLFYMSRKSTTLEGNDVTVLTLTPVGTYIPTAAPNDLTALANEFMALPKEQLYDHATQADQTVEISITASLNGKTNTKNYYFTLVAANIDEDIVEHLIEHESLLNVVSYETVGDDTSIVSIANLARDENNRYEVEYLTETMIIPETITLTNFGNTSINVTSSISVPGGQTIFEATKNATIESNIVAAKTLTPLGSYSAPGVTPGDLTELSDAITALPTKDLYNYSQTGAVDVDITITAELNGIEKNTTLYIRLVPAELDHKIGEAIMDEFNVLNIGNVDFAYNGVPLTARDSMTPQELHFFTDTIIIPKSFILNDYGSKEVSFDVVVNGSSFYEGTKDLVYEAQNIDVYTFTPTGDYDTSPYATVTDLLNHFKAQTPGDLILMSASQSEVTGVSFVVTAKIGGVAVAERTYYFNIVKHTI